MGAITQFIMVILYRILAIFIKKYWLNSHREMTRVIYQKKKSNEKIYLLFGVCVYVWGGATGTWINPLIWLQVWHWLRKHWKEQNANRYFVQWMKYQVLIGEHIFIHRIIWADKKYGRIRQSQYQWQKECRKFMIFVNLYLRN